MIPVQAIIAEDTGYTDTHWSKVGQFLGEGEQSYTLGRRRPGKVLVGTPACRRVKPFNLGH